MRRKLVENATVAGVGVGILIGAGTLRGAGYPGWSIPFFLLGALIILFAVADFAFEGLKPPLSWTWAYARRVRIHVGLAPIGGVPPIRPSSTSPTVQPPAVPPMPFKGVLWMKSDIDILEPRCPTHLMALRYADFGNVNEFGDPEISHLGQVGGAPVDSNHYCLRCPGRGDDGAHFLKDVYWESCGVVDRDAFERWPAYEADWRAKHGTGG